MSTRDENYADSTQSDSETDLVDDETDVSEYEPSKSSQRVSYSQQQSLISTPPRPNPSAPSFVPANYEPLGDILSPNSTAPSTSTPRAPSLSDSNPTNQTASRTKKDKRLKRSSGSFRKDSLNAIFEKIEGVDSKHLYARCKGCKEVIKSTEECRLLPHIRRCRSIDEELKEEAIGVDEGERKSLSKNQRLSSDLNYKLAQVIIKNNLPFRILSCPLFKTIIKDIEPSWNLASRSTMSCKFIPLIATKAKKDFMHTLSVLGDHSLSIEFDHWRDVNHRSILAIVATLIDGKRYLIKLEDVSIRGHSTSSILESLIEGLHLLPSRCINAIMSDSASSCKAARQKLVTKVSYSHVIQYRCIAHFVNSIGNLLTSDDCITILLSWASKLTSYINNQCDLSAKLKSIGVKRLAKPTTVRWYSNVDMMESLVALRKDAEDLVTKELKDTEARGVFVADLFWKDLTSLLAILRPLVNCIATAERAHGSLGESMKALLEWAKSLFDSDWNNPYITVALSSFLNYFNSSKLGDDELGIMLTAYCLDKHHKLNYLTATAHELIFETLVKLALRGGIPKSTITTVLIDEYEKFKNQEGLFARPIEVDEPALTWWKNTSNLGIMRNIAVRVASLKSSSANTERIFSILKLIQGTTRNRFTIETLESVARAKLSMIDANDLELFSLVSEEERIFDNEPQDKIPSIPKTDIRKGISLSRLARKLKKLPSKILNIDNQDDASSSSQISKLTDPTTKENLKNFNKYIDFSIINSFEDTLHPEFAIEESNSVDDILQTYRQRQG